MDVITLIIGILNIFFGILIIQLPKLLRWIVGIWFIAQGALILINILL
ncbi:MAG: hypothetical protein V1740_05030 [Candidatus Woesearchaeota archaeon]